MTNYLPVLLVSVNTNSIPDDSSVCTLPRGQVDYLSHNWEEEDVWRSWRNMTRQKNEIANGMRLENASWRTWWKQRNKLKTVTPETLNWLKDSDVTWLYGPLHTAVDWAPPPKPKSDPTSVDDKNPATAQDRLDLSLGARGMKPILKHRSICELLTSDLPSSPIYSSPGSDAERGDVAEGEDLWINGEDLDGSNIKGLRNKRDLERPPLLHTKSDSHITRRPTHVFRKDSPPRIIAEESAVSPSTPGSTTSKSSYGSDRKSSITTQTSGSDQDPAPGAFGTNGHGKKKHISFNTFVEQCIAIEKPKCGRDGSAIGSDTPRNSNMRVYDSGYDDGYDEDSESGVLEDDEDDVLFTRVSNSTDPSQHDHFDTHSNSDSEDDEDDEVLEIRTTSIRQRISPGRSSSSSSSSGSSRSRSSGGPKRYSTTPTSSSRSLRYGPALVRTPSAEKEHMTILPIAPTILKTKGVGNGSGGDDDDYDYPVTINDSGRWHGAGTDAPVHLVYVPPLGSNYSMDSGELNIGEDIYRHREAYFSVGTGATVDRPVPSSVTPTPSSGDARVLYQTSSIASPGDGEGAEDDAYDYFEGPDMGVALAGRRTQSQRNGRQELPDNGAANAGGPDMVKYAEGGTAKVVIGCSSGTPEVVVKGVSGAVESKDRSRSRSRSRSRTPSPAEFASSPSVPSIPVPSSIVAVPHVDLSHSIERTSSSALLSPPDILPSRGRGSTPVLENQPRGRSVARNSSFSDRERSSSRGTNSPIGSISPEGSTVGIARGSAYGVYANGRDRDAASRRGMNERGRMGRRDNNASVEDVRTALGRFGDGRRVASTASTSSGSSTASASSTAVPSHGSSPLRISTECFDLAPAVSPSIPIPIPEATEQEQLQRSRHPTPSNSPDSNMKHSILVPPPQPSASTTVSHTPKGIVIPPQSPTSVKALEEGTLVGRAVEIVSSAGAFLGSIWQGNART